MIRRTGTAIAAAGVKIAAMALAGMLALSGCGSGGAGQGAPATGTARADTISATVAYASRDFSPSTTSSALSLAGNWHVTEPLYAFDYSTFEVFDALAKGEPKQVSDTEYVVTLRDGAKFSDGTPVTPADVVKSYERTTAEGSLYVPMLSFIDSVEAQGANQVVFRLKQPFPLLKQRLTLIQVAPASASDEDLKKMPIGSGPWKYVDITDQQVKFERNDQYNGDYPAQAKNMVWSVKVDDTARITEMQAGKTDAMELVPASAVKTLEASGAEMKTAQGFNQAFVMFNTAKKPFDDKRVRQAVFYAIDVDKLIKDSLLGQAEAATSYLPESFPYYHKAANVYTKDLDKAKALLDEAGVSGGKFTLYTTDQTWITSLAPQIKNDLAEIGFDVDVQSLASAALYPNVADKDDFSMILAPGDPSVFGNDPDLLMNWYYGDNVWTRKRSHWNGSEGYATLHEYMDKALAAKDDAERQAWWSKCYDLLSDELPLYPLFHRTTTTAVRKGAFSSFEPIGSTGLNFVKAKLNQ